MSPFSLMIFYLNRCNAAQLAKKRFREKDVEAVLRRLDRLTQDEARTAAVEILKVVYGHIQNMNVLMEGDQTRSVQFHHPPSVDHRSY